MKQAFLSILLVLALPLTSVISSSTQGQANLEMYLVLHGAFVLEGKQPDGDSIRFQPDDPNLLQKLKRANRIEPSKDGTVQLRLEGIDAPELHFENLAQPRSKESRDALLTWFGFTDVTYTPKGLQVKTSSPKLVRGAILAQAAEVYGRPISYALLERDSKPLEDGSRITVGADLLSRTINAHMLETGMAYYTAYSSQPAEHRTAFRAMTETARREKRGLWTVDVTSKFMLSTLEDMTEKQVILPKLFRRAVVYLQDREKGFTGTLADWFAAHPDRDDRLEVNGRRTKLSSVLEVDGDIVVLLVDFLDVVLLEN